MTTTIIPIPHGHPHHFSYEALHDDCQAWVYWPPAVPPVLFQVAGERWSGATPKPAQRGRDQMERAKVEKSMCLKTFPFSKSIIFLYKVWSLNAKYWKNFIVDFLKLCASDRGERRRICFYLVATDSPRLAAYTKHTLRTSSFLAPQVL